MPEFLVNYRSNTTGELVNVHVANVDGYNTAHLIIDNYLLDAEDYYFESIKLLEESNSTPF